MLFFVAFLGVPIAFALGGSAAVVLFISGVPPTQYPLALWGGTQGFTMLAIPLFVFVGGIMSKSKIADALIDFSETLVGWTPGALAHVNVLVSTLFGGISGIAAADMASIGNIMLHQMQRKGYPKNFSVAISSFSSILNTTQG